MYPTTSLSFLILSGERLEFWFPAKIYLLLVTLVGVGGLLSELAVTVLKLDFGVINCEIVLPFLLKACVERLFYISEPIFKGLDVSFFPRNISKSSDHVTLFYSL